MYYKACSCCGVEYPNYEIRTIISPEGNVEQVCQSCNVKRNEENRYRGEN